MEQIDALRAMLAETADYWDDMRIDVKYGLWTDGKDTYANVIRPAEMNVKALIAAMHNALPDLLDATEMVEALTWVWNTIGDCEACPHRKGCFEEPNASWCNGGIFDHAAEWLAAWRERKTDASSI